MTDTPATTAQIAYLNRLIDENRDLLGEPRSTPFTPDLICKADCSTLIDDYKRANRSILDGYRREHEAEMYAENAWLRHAERDDRMNEESLIEEANDAGLQWMRAQREQGGDPCPMCGALLNASSAPTHECQA